MAGVWRKEQKSRIEMPADDLEGRNARRGAKPAPRLILLCDCLQNLHVLSLPALRSLYHIELDRLAFLE